MKDNVNIVAVGDIMLGEMPGNNGKGIDSYLKKNGYENAFQFVEREFSDSDIVFGNIEAVLDKIPKFINVKESSLTASPLSVQSLKKIHLKIAHIANNHILDHGIESFVKTNDLLEDIGANIIGSVYGNKINSIIEIDDIKFNYIGVSIAIDKNHNKDYYFRTDNIDDILKIVNNTKHYADHTIVSIHWGNEHINLPNPKQIEFAHQLIDNGVSLILGHHPHCYQGIEKYKNGIIVYSLGNFVFDLDYPMSKETLIFKCIFNKKGLLNFEVIPIIINKYGLPTLPDNEKSTCLREKYSKIDNEIINVITIDKEQYKLIFKNYYVDAYKSFKRFTKIKYLTRLFSINPKISLSMLISFVKHKYDKFYRNGLN